MDIFTFAGKWPLVDLFLLYNSFPNIKYSSSDARTMAKEVKDIFLETIQTHGNKSRQEAEDYLKRMESQRRYSADVWS